MNLASFIPGTGKLNRVKVLLKYKRPERLNVAFLKKVMSGPDGRLPDSYQHPMIFTFRTLNVHFSPSYFPGDAVSYRFVYQVGQAISVYSTSSKENVCNFSGPPFIDTFTVKSKFFAPSK
ncbi:hypothetical protein B5T_00359 [Alloalcanivorax dieselolei B5]|uniref:Uncharacterized protein n=1 Tax=Alcanivorax dieselolei (strain DSM 16502 / CGMCC 1.3690 / MCCC 1A00001 / B-5) TaxID=930169 RepID=K0CAY1_ALCDB|nr:hypothetical protein B5T_00359 [Alloalcanivorax dieselolei B5]